MNVDRISTGKRSASVRQNRQTPTVTRINVKSSRTVRQSSDHQNKDNNNNNIDNLAIERTNQTSIRSYSMNNRLTSTTRSVSVTKIHRPSSQHRQKSHKTIDDSDEKTNSMTKHISLQTRKVVAHQNNIINQSNLKSNLTSLETVEDLINPIHRSSKNQKMKNLIQYCCQCSRRRIVLSLISLILLGIILAIILLNKPKSTSNNKPLIPAILRWNTTGITLFGTTSIRGNQSTQLSSPFGLLFDSLNDLYIADRYNHRIQKCQIRMLTCQTIAGQANAVAGTNITNLNGPTFIYIDQSNHLYIADSGNQRIQFWNYGASFGKTIAGITGSGGSGLNQFNTPYGIALDTNSNAIYIADYNNHRIMKYFSGNLTGTIVAGGNGLGTNKTQLYRPAGLVFDSSTNSLIITNFGASNIVRWVLNDNKWTILFGDSNGINGNTSTYLDHATSLTFDPMGNIYVADMFNHRIQMYALGQSNGTTIAGISGRLGNNSTMLNYPVSVAFDSQLNLYVTDSLNHRIQQFLRY